MPLSLWSYFSPSSNPANAESLIASLGVIAKSTANLKDEISKWQGDTLGATLILGCSTKIIFDINASTSIVNAIEGWTNDEADKILATTEDISKHVGHAIDATIVARPKFRRIPFFGDSVTIALLRRQQSAATDLSCALISKTREAIMREAEAVACRIDGHFTRAIEAFNSECR